MRSGRFLAALVRRCAYALAVPLLLAAPLGCGATFDGTVYRGDGFAFRVKPPPPNWKRIEVSHAALAYRAQDGDGTIALNARCGVDGEDVPLASLTQHLFIQFTEREILSQNIVPFDGREAMHTVLSAKLDGVPKRFDVFILKKDGCVYDLYYIAAPERYARGAPDFDHFVQGFSTLSTHAAD